MPCGDTVRFLTRQLQAGSFRLGQVVVSSDLSIVHAEDIGRNDLEHFTDAHSAVEIAKYDEEGGYRPLKGAPNLRRGWKLALETSEHVVLALEFLYPAALGNLMAFEADALEPVPLRATLDRQTGMYAVVRKMTDAQAQDLIGQVCDLQQGCLRRILWSIDDRTAGARTETAQEIQERLSGGELPILCAEACNFFIAAGRKVVKGR